MHLPDEPLAGRWRLLARLGTGAAGVVFRAEDLTTGGFVAVKILTDATPQQRGRFEREARVLRQLGVPGVVRLLAEGEHEGQRFLVTELVDGAPFPGQPGPVPWARLAPTVLRLFETLAAVHAAGVLHRDLKPANVLVDEAGAPTVLDFGLSRYDGAISLTRTGDVLGTPRYQAPEQILGDHPVDARADLYAAGVMLYEALAGRPPQPTRSVGRVYAARLVHDAPPIGAVAPELPPVVARLVDQLVARAPEDRPGSARAVLDALAGTAPARRAGELRFLGPSDAVERAREALLAGRAVDVVGPRGGGRSRFSDELAAALTAAGRPVVSLPAGERPFESLAAALRIPPPDRDAAVLALRAHADAGGVVIVDDPDAVDPWTTALLGEVPARVVARLENPGTAREGDKDEVRAQRGDTPGADAITLGPLPAAALTALFAGGGREAEAAATLLAERTGGLPSRVAAEVGRWVAEGRAAWAGDRLKLAPEARWEIAAGPPADVRLGRRGVAGLSEALERALGWIALAEPWARPAELAAARRCPTWEVEAELGQLAARGLVRRDAEGRWWTRPELVATEPDGGRPAALRALADAAPQGSRARFARLCAAEAWAEAALAAPALAARAIDGGDGGLAWGTAAWGLRAAFEADGPIAPVVPWLARAALALGTPAALRTAATLVAGAAARAPADRAVDRIAALLAAAADPEALATLPPLDDPALADFEAARADLLFARRLAVDPAGAADHVDALATPAGPRARARRLAMDAGVRLAAGRGPEAVTLLERALREPSPPLERFALRTLLAEALLEAGEHAAAHREATALAEQAASHGLLHCAGHAAAIARDAAVRAGTGGDPSPAAVADAEALGIAGLTARVCLTEAVAAWRSGDYAEAARLARRAVAADPDGGRVPILARALELACGQDALPAACAALVARADRLGDPAVALQVRGLVALASAARADGLLADAEDLAARAGRLGEARAVLSPAEALAFCRVGARRRGARRADPP